LNGLDIQINELNKNNHDIVIKNVKLETENRTLREHLNFLNNILDKHLRDNPIRTPANLFAQKS